jgi:hypothetical protein
MSKRKYAELSNTDYKWNGTNRTLKEWAEVLGIDYPTIRMRYVRGKRGHELFSKPLEVEGRRLPKVETRVYLVKRVEKLEQRLEALKSVVLELVERINND